MSHNLGLRKRKYSPLHFFSVFSLTMNQIESILEQHEATEMSVALCLSEHIACAKQVQ